MRNATVRDLGELDLEEPAPPPPRRPPRRRGPVAALVVGGVAAGWLVLGGGDPDRPSPSPPSPTTTAFPPPAMVPYAPWPLDDVIVLGAPVGYEDTGSLAVVDGTAVTRRDHDVHLWPGDYRHPIVVVADRLLWADELARVWSAPVTLDDDPVIIGAGRELVPALDPTAVWVRRDDGRAVQMDVSGTERVEVPLPAESSFVAEVEGGLLLETATALEVWEPTSGARRRVYDARAVLATSATHVALDGGLVVDVRTGAVSPWAPVRADVHAAAFSPDGSLLAMWQGPIGLQRTGIAIYDVDRSGARQFAKLQSIDGVVADRLVWSPDSDAVYALVSDDGVGGQRVIGIPVGGDPQTVVSVNRNGWYWLAVA